MAEHIVQCRRDDRMEKCSAASLQGILSDLADMAVRNVAKYLHLADWATLQMVSPVLQMTLRSPVGWKVCIEHSLQGFDVAEDLLDAPQRLQLMPLLVPFFKVKWQEGLIALPMTSLVEVEQLSKAVSTANREAAEHKSRGGHFASVVAGFLRFQPLAKVVTSLVVGGNTEGITAAMPRVVETAAQAFWEHDSDDDNDDIDEDIFGEGDGDSDNEMMFPWSDNKSSAVITVPGYKDLAEDVPLQLHFATCKGDFAAAIRDDAMPSSVIEHPWSDGDAFREVKRERAAIDISLICGSHVIRHKDLGCGINGKWEWSNSMNRAQTDMTKAVSEGVVCVVTLRDTQPVWFHRAIHLDRSIRVETRIQDPRPPQVVTDSPVFSCIAASRLVQSLNLEVGRLIHPRQSIYR